MPLPAAETSTPPTSRSTRSIRVLLNAKSGSATAPEIRDRVEQLFAAAGSHAQVELIANPAEIESRARALAAHDVVLVAAGGDGTVSTVAAVVAERGGILGVLPLGTLNHFAKDLHIPLDLAKAVDTIAHGRIERVDVGDVNGHTFINNSSLGLYPRLVWEREAEQKRGHGKWASLAIAVVRTWRKYRMLGVRLMLDGMERVAVTSFVFIGNNEYIASGLNLGGRTTLTGGVLSLYVAPTKGRVDLLRLVIRAIVKGLDRDPNFLTWKIEQARVDTWRRRVSVAVDGEVRIMAPPLRYRSRPRALPVFVPSESDA